MRQIDAQFARLELSSQLLIQEALQRGIQVELLDEQDNILRLSWDKRQEYVMQASRTSADNYISPLLMNNKIVTKKLLAEVGIPVPSGYVFLKAPDLSEELLEFKQGSWIIKPNSTNFGIGITKLQNADEQEIRSAFRLAFSHDSQVIAEEYIEGKEYRFLVIDGRVRAILHRVPANITGDGVHSITELVQEKNKDPRRGTGYRLPLEQLKLGEVEAAVLAESGLHFASIPAPGEIIYIRKNSNISTGGDSIDMTGKLHPDYDRIAVRATEALGAKICGVDIIIAEGAETHAIGAKLAGALDAGQQSTEAQTAGLAVIELNFNPALHIHDFPAVGENRRVERYILDLLMQER